MSDLIPFKRGQVAKALQGIDHGPALGEAVAESVGVDAPIGAGRVRTRAGSVAS